MQLALMAKESRKKYNNFVKEGVEEVKKPPTPSRPSSHRSTKSANKEGTFLTDMLFKGKPNTKQPSKPKPVKQEDEKEDSEEYD